MHDPRLGRFFAIDPLAPKYPHNSPYAFSENRLLDGVELEGLEVRAVGFYSTYSVIFSISHENGLVLGPDGLFGYGSGGYGFETDISASAEIAFTYYPKMPMVDGFFNGTTYSIGPNGSIGLVTGGFSFNKCSGYAGMSFHAGAGSPGPIPITVSGYKSETGIIRISSINLDEYMPLIKKITKKITDQRKMTESSIKSINELIETKKSENKVTQYLLDNTELDKNTREKYEDDINNNRSSIDLLEKQNKVNKNYLKEFDETLEIINNNLDQIKQHNNEDD